MLELRKRYFQGILTVGVSYMVSISRLDNCQKDKNAGVGSRTVTINIVA